MTRIKEDQFLFASSAFICDTFSLISTLEFSNLRNGRSNFFRKFRLENHRVKLFFFGRAAQCRGRRRAAGNRLPQRVEISRADKRLVFCGAITVNFRSEKSFPANRLFRQKTK